ncbi:5'/3'-nucleotidase SurE [Candidatus Parvarchaeota archaeon]|uniref:5'-nucleotidase SurE n=1 Tax=Candidatus Acidifodinimicrobium mancum TaxID=2898728 RepID=A0A8T3UVD9_9ARCH|nr:5'/3'-nucleotidase SurE [Candidatus Acidifodinimicrobium mancum]MBE5728728.1 5'/3'-nucleotidase SurE [Candidatus Acidifodinimicrobium mancum]MBE5730290.1 5'/3'-nucleotidase SurE [Candidatus Acidifodinimicrobium mancum]
MILVTNDDGYSAKGISVLHKAAMNVFGDEVAVVAPESPRSASGMSLTFHKPLRLEKIYNIGEGVYKLSGTPADCVFIAYTHLFKDKISMVLSGINEGMNAGIETIYSSGTVSAAMYGAILGIPSIAFSKHKTRRRNEDDSSALLKKTEKILEVIKAGGFPKYAHLINVNFPDTVREDTKVKALIPQHKVFLNHVYVKKDPRGRKYYWLFGDIITEKKAETDVSSLLKGNITITPLQIAKPNRKDLNSMNKLFRRV